MFRLLNIGLVLFAAIVVMPALGSRASAQTGATASEDPNDKAEQDRSFEETRKHMQLHSNWSKKTGKMNDK